VTTPEFIEKAIIEAGSRVNIGRNDAEMRTYAWVVELKVKTMVKIRAKLLSAKGGLS